MKKKCFWFGDWSLVRVSGHHQMGLSMVHGCCFVPSKDDNFSLCVSSCFGDVYDVPKYQLARVLANVTNVMSRISCWFT
jgi:hypothetical protein